MTEARFWSSVQEDLRRYGKLVRVENPAHPGTADVSYCLRRNPATAAVSGWIELKQMPAWSVKPDGHARRPRHYTREQMMFLRDWTAAGGSAFLLLQVGRVGNPLILMNAALAGRFFHETLTVRGLLAEATIIGTYRELLLCLTRT